jgi:hypothetical protein
VLTTEIETFGSSFGRKLTLKLLNKFQTKPLKLRKLETFFPMFCKICRKRQAGLGTYSIIDFIFDPFWLCFLLQSLSDLLFPWLLGWFIFVESAITKL